MKKLSKTLLHKTMTNTKNQDALKAGKAAAQKKKKEAKDEIVYLQAVSFLEKLNKIGNTDLDFDLQPLVDETTGIWSVARIKAIRVDFERGYFVEIISPCDEKWNAQICISGVDKGNGKKTRVWTL